MRRMWVALALLLAAWPASGRAAGVTELSGQVTGVGGQPLADAEVELFAFGRGRIALAATDGEGYFRFPGLADTSVYWVRAWAPGYRVAEAAWAGGDAWPFLALAPAPHTATLLVRAADPASGAPVAAATFSLQQPGRGEVARAGGGGSGTARLQVLAGDGYLLQVWAPGRAAAVLAVPALAGGAARSLTVPLAPATGRVTGVVADPSGAPLAGAFVQVLRTGFGVVATAATGPDGSVAVELPAGAEYRLRALAPGFATRVAGPITLAAGTTRDFSGEAGLRLTPATATLAGRVVDPDGNPAAGQTVLLQRQPFGTVASARLGADGAFRFAGLPARPGVLYRVQVLPGEGYWQAAASDWAELPGGKVTEVALHLERGLVRDGGETGGLLGRVSDAGGRPVAGARVELWRAGTGLLRTVSSGTDGAFRFTAVPANRGTAPWAVRGNGYYLKVTAPGMFPTTLAAAGDLDVVFNRDTAVAVTLYPQQVALAGRTMDGGGNPLAATGVELLPEPGGAPLAARTDASGRWQVTADPLLTYRVQANREGYAGAAADLTPDPAGIAARDLTLQPLTATLTGRVSNGYGQPVAGAALRAWSPAGETIASADGDGTFRLTVAAGQPYLLQAGAQGHGVSGLGPDGALQPLTPAPGAWPEVELRLWPAGGRVLGTVRAAGGQPVPGVLVELVREGEGVVALAETDARGRYRFPAVPAGHRYAVRTVVGRYRDPGRPGLPPLFTLAPGGVETVHLEWLEP